MITLSLFLSFFCQQKKIIPAAYLTLRIKSQKRERRGHPKSICYAALYGYTKESFHERAGPQELAFTNYVAGRRGR